ncbi:MAG: hypothetical protein DDT29_01722 [Dehalococcoidia bacterium]|nr:hypothetical protein [Bacillota bacterium]
MAIKSKKAISKGVPSFSWDAANTPDVISKALNVISENFPVGKGSKGTRLVFRQIEEDGKCRVKRSKGEILIEYSRPNMAIRAVGALLSGIDIKEEYCPFLMFGIMIDCSRNAVMTVDHMKKYLEKIAFLGYNMVMLYTEDTYQIKDEPFFGYMRGAYTEEELRGLDQFASRLGIEMIPCIQTLGHLEQILKWPAFWAQKDTSGVLLVDEEKTYELIEKMIVTWKNSVESKRIHVGMDEAHDIGRGRFYDFHGDERHFDIFNRHLGKVVSICRKHGLKPMIWSDMYFRMGDKNGDYYGKDTVIPEDVAKAIPKGTELVYWDYYHDNKEFYLDWIGRHRKLGKEPLMGSGVWTWSKFWYDRQITEKNVRPCVEACREARLEEVFFTMWGDEGGYCDFDSAFAGLAYVAELSFTGEASNKALNAKLKSLFDGSSYDDIIMASAIEEANPASVLWDDPLMLIFTAGAKFRDMEGKDKYFTNALRICADISRKLAKSKARGSAGDMALIKALTDAVAAKLTLADALVSGYLKKNRKAMAKIKPFIADYDRKLKKFAATFRAMWLRNNKPFGLETMQIRFAGQEARLKELSVRLQEYLDGKVKSIPELEEIQRAGGNTNIWGYGRISHGSLII